jgi:hypothetical protein
MLRKLATVIALAAIVAPAAGRTQEWEEDYPASDEAQPSDDYSVSVDMDSPDATASVDLQTFQEALQPYGEWVVVGSYGRVWRPHVASGWRPYYYGRWEWTDEGWLWASEEPFGWAAYHYGRWAFDPYYGWLWVPGYQWAPAWVSWRYSGDVVGWAPLAPGVSVYVSGTPFSDAWWTFVPCNDFVAVPVYRVAYAPTYSHRWFQATAPAPARPGFRTAPGRAAAPPAWGGPPRRSIEERIGRPVTPVRVVVAPSPGEARTRQGEVAIYRPELRRHPGVSTPGSPAPRSVPPGWSGERRTQPGTPGIPSPRPPSAPAGRGGDLRERGGDQGHFAPRNVPGPAVPGAAKPAGQPTFNAPQQPQAQPPVQRQALQPQPPAQHQAPQGGQGVFRAAPGGGQGAGPAAQGGGPLPRREEVRPGGNGAAGGAARAAREDDKTDRGRR